MLATRGFPSPTIRQSTGRRRPPPKGRIRGLLSSAEEALGSEPSSSAGASRLPPRPRTELSARPRFPPRLSACLSRRGRAWHDRLLILVKAVRPERRRRCRQEQRVGLSGILAMCGRSTQECRSGPGLDVPASRARDLLRARTPSDARACRSRWSFERETRARSLVEAHPQTVGRGRGLAAKGVTAGLS